MHDLVIRGASLVDGRGGQARTADLAIDDGLISEIGMIEARGTREILADGRLVTPGFVDIHTHLDAQVWWDPLLTSSCWHGVTSAVLGNCGVTFAPVRPTDHRTLAEWMESVEDIPADVIMDGLDWHWESYGGYLDSLEQLPKAFNVGGMVGHCAVRLYAMGERAVTQHEAGVDDIAAMCVVVDDAMSAGALGFSSSRTPLHVVGDGRAVPGTFAGKDELLALARVLGTYGRGVCEVVPSFVDNPMSLEGEMEILTSMSRTSGRPVTFTLTQPPEAPRMHREVLADVAAARADGIGLYPQTTVRSVGLLYTPAHRGPFDRAPAWRAMRTLDLTDRLAAMRDAVQRDRLIEDADAHAPLFSLSSVFVMPIGEGVYTNDPSTSLTAWAERMGTTPAGAYIELALERDGNLICIRPFLNDQAEAVEEMLADPHTVLGLGDAGAHVGSILDASQPTWLLSHWTRDRGVFSVPEAIRKLTSDPARLYGLHGRGELRVGAHADINVIDLEALHLNAPEFVYDYPGGTGRYVQHSRGYDYTVVNGEVVLEAGAHCGPLPGRVLRGTQ
jgi:N-acyl-D-amino-acid deacylase